IREEAFRVDANGKLVLPPEFPGPPLPWPLELNRLTAAQQNAWTALPTAKAPGNANSSAVSNVEPFEHFLSLNPPEEFIPLARLGKGRALAAQYKTLEASNEFRGLLQQFPGARLESGLPLGPIVEWEIVQLAF